MLQRIHWLNTTPQPLWNAQRCSLTVAVVDAHDAAAVAVDAHAHADGAVFRPDVQRALLRQGVTTVIGGWLASANYLGYLLGALSATTLRIRPATAIRIGLATIVVATFGMGAAHTFNAWVLLRTVAGIGSTRYAYAFEDAKADGGPYRSLEFRVYAVAASGTSGSPAVLAATNPQVGGATGISTAAAVSSR